MSRPRFLRPAIADQVSRGPSLVTATTATAADRLAPEILETLSQRLWTAEIGRRLDLQARRAL